MSFESAEALNKAIHSTGKQEVAADVNRISSGGVPTIMVGQQICDNCSQVLFIKNQSIARLRNKTSI